MIRSLRSRCPELLLDLRHSVRALARRPALAGVAVVSLALGIGANAALFGVADAVLFEVLPYEEPERLVRVWETFPAPGGELWTGTVSPPNLADWRAASERLEVGAYHLGSVNLTSGGEPIRSQSVRVDGEVFRILGRDAARGRVLGPADLAGDGRVVVVSDRLWRERLGADPAAVGATVELAGAAYEVVGVMPPGFDFPPDRGTSLWLPLLLTESERENRSSHWLSVIGRLRPGVDLEQARTEMDGIALRLREEHPGPQRDRGVRIRTLRETRIGDARPVLLALWAAVGFVLLIASGNVAHLLLARAADRRRELAVRSALGAPRSRLAAQVLSESFLLAGAGGVLGLLLGRAALGWIARLPGAALPEIAAIRLDARVFAYSLGVALAAAALAGLLPAWQASRVDLRAALGAARGTVGRRDRLRGVLVVAEVALAAVVVLGAALMVRSVVELTAVDTGLVGTERVLTMKVPVPAERYGTAAERVAFWDRVLGRVTALPGVEAAGIVTMLPLQEWGWNGQVSVEGRPQLPEGEAPWVEYRVASEGYFGAIGNPLVAGRDFAAVDDAEATPVAVVDRTLARLYWGDEDPLGGRLGYGRSAEDVGTWWTVVGVVDDVRNSGLDRHPRPTVFVSMRQNHADEVSLVVRSAGRDPASLAGPVAGAIREVDPLQPVHRVLPMERVLREHVADRTFTTVLLTVWAGLAVLLAVVGVYSVLSHDVSLRRSEIGLRMALGADRARVLHHVLGRGARLAALGAACGVGLALAGTRLLESRLYGVEPHDPPTFAAGALALVVVASVASLLPALRAASVEPTRALRGE